MWGLGGVAWGGDWKAGARRKTKRPSMQDQRPFHFLCCIGQVENLARPAGFEPTTPWFVARYSIQLSYGRSGKEAKLYQKILPFLLHLRFTALALLELARPAGFEPTTPWFVARYSIQLSYGRVSKQALNNSVI